MLPRVLACATPDDTADPLFRESQGLGPAYIRGSAAPMPWTSRSV